MLLIRTAAEDDRGAIWKILEPAIRTGETNALPREMSETQALAYWMAAEHEVFVAEADRAVLGTMYLRANQPGGGAHVANCGYVTARDATGRGVASQLCEFSLRHARARGFTAMQFNFLISTNERAVRLWQRFGFDIVGRLPGAFAHPRLGPVDALVMFQTL